MQMLDLLRLMSMADNNLMPAVPPLAPQIPPVPEPVIPAALAPIDSTLVDHLTVSDQSRKRCASELEEHRTVKALKREPQDDAPLSIINDAPLHSQPHFAPQPPIAFPLMQPFGGGPPSRPASRPPTPTGTYSARNSFTMKQPAPASMSFTPFATGGASLPLGHSSVPSFSSGSGSTSTFPTLTHASWSDPAVPTTTRHHHSLSAGSAGGSIIGLSTPTSALGNGSMTPATMQNGLQQPMMVPSNAAAANISPPIGRMSRSGSISGVMKNPYATLAYPDANADSSWKGKKPVRQSNWYISSEQVHSSSSRNTGHHTTSSAPATAHNSPSDDEDDDEESDSDDESPSGKTVAHHVSSC